MALSQGLGPGKNAETRLPATATTPVTHPRTRQRGDGGLPSGNNRATNANSAFIGTQSHTMTQAATLPPGNTPPSTASA